MVASARKVASWVLGVSRARSKVVMPKFNQSLIRSKLEYCSPLWNRDIETIEDVQRLFTNRISGMSDLSYWDRLTGLNIQSLQRIKEWYIITTPGRQSQEMYPMSWIYSLSKAGGLEPKLLFPP